MRRSLNTLRVSAGLLLLGLATSVLVAWALAIAFQSRVPLRNMAREDVEVVHKTMWLFSEDPGRLFATPLSSTSNRYARHPFLEEWEVEHDFTAWVLRGIPFTDRVQYPGESKLGTLRNINERAHGWRYQIYGWPIPVLYRTCAIVRTPSGGFEHNTIRFRSQILPGEIVWRSFAASTALYGFSWAIVLVFVPAGRRWLRHRRGLCINCGYDITGCEICPECGTTTNPAADVAAINLASKTSA